MKKIVFDSSIHLGQFCLDNEDMRIFAKNSQVLISSKPSTEVIGVESFNENAMSDDIIWSLEREPQDTFYKFMDVYHSVKSIERVPLRADDAIFALTIAKQFSIDISNALTCALALRYKANEIHSLYAEFNNSQLQAELAKNNITVITASRGETEKSFAEPGLEQFYQAALAVFRQHDLNLVEKFHS